MRQPNESSRGLRRRKKSVGRNRVYRTVGMGIVFGAAEEKTVRQVPQPSGGAAITGLAGSVRRTPASPSHGDQPFFWVGHRREAHLSRSGASQRDKEASSHGKGQGLNQRRGAANRLMTYPAALRGANREGAARRTASRPVHRRGSAQGSGRSAAHSACDNPGGQRSAARG